MDSNFEKFQSNFEKFQNKTDLLAQTLSRLPEAGRVIDYGCCNWLVSTLAREVGRSDLSVIGVDPYGEPPGRPEDARFMMLARPGAPLPVRGADLLVAANVLEHCHDGVEVFGTWLEAIKPGGLIYVEAPSEDTLLMSSDPDVEGQAYKSFWDDPTHVRPWPPAALYRLALSWGSRPEACFYAMCAGNHSGVSLIRRIDPEPPRYRYVSLRDVPRGVDAALRHVSSLSTGRYLGG
jgi:SAM-dependent methyltransferase